ncbi:hypothetical protein [Enterococcus wangshanyuanii]|uniref:Uncharacterized protein n=1 Tax=Enterococcus wangshanyuanii TaxID=2005703 RepID=A0ABQ1PPN6_9ENTE|nr:hypothetical protein [Enterococcus wangshanyuanii]GGD00599.1 hypothetical protein GCM10011573_32730 [Enterococcus wangshanyuanii]
MGKYKTYYIFEGICLISWVVYLGLFLQLYKEAIFYVDSNAAFIIQLLFLVEYYFSSLFTYFIIGFLLITSNLYVLLFFHIKSKQNREFNLIRYSLIIFLVIFLISVGILLQTKLWPIFLLLVVLAATIVFITYALTKHQEDEVADYGVNEIVKELGPFSTEEIAMENTNNFFDYWQKHFEKTNYVLAYDMHKNNDSEYSVEIYVKSIVTAGETN